MNIERKEKSLYLDEVKLSQVADTYGTPAYVVSEEEILSQFQALREEFLDQYPNTRVAYAAKAFFPLYMARLIERTGLCVDVVSGGELYTALKGGIDPERIELNGNNKLREELELAIEYNVGRIIVDGVGELALIEEIAREKGKVPRLLLRITPGVESDTHDYIVTGRKDSKFGFPCEEEILFPLIKTCQDSENLDLLGFHFHVGSQLFDNQSHIEALETLLKMAEEIQRTYDLPLREINLGGGFGVRYTDEDRKSYRYFLSPLMERITEYSEKNHIPRPAVVIEPGRSIVAEAGLTLYSVGEVKEIPGIRTYVNVDGGMTDNIRPALYGAEYRALPLEERGGEYQVVTISGKCCESGDVLIRDIPLAPLKRGDRIAVLATGAYGYAMASHYNKIPKPPVIVIRDGKAEVVVKRETYEDMMKNEI